MKKPPKKTPKTKFSKPKLTWRITSEDDYSSGSIGLASYDDCLDFIFGIWTNKIRSEKYDLCAFPAIGGLINGAYEYAREFDLGDYLSKCKNWEEFIKADDKKLIKINQNTWVGDTYFGPGKYQVSELVNCMFNSEWLDVTSPRVGTVPNIKIIRDIGNKFGWEFMEKESPFEEFKDSLMPRKKVDNNLKKKVSVKQCDSNGEVLPKILEKIWDDMIKSGVKINCKNFLETIRKNEMKIMYRNP